VPALDHRTYEAETARVTDGTPVAVARQPYGDRVLTWSGTGFMRMHPHSSIEFVVDNIPESKLYDVVVRFEPQVTGKWDNVQLIIKRPIGIDPFGSCGNYSRGSDTRGLSFTSMERHAVAESVCLEKNTRYIIQLQVNEFERSPIDGEAPSILIDSVWHFVFEDLVWLILFYFADCHHSSTR